jgi:NADH-quinone oxidoreductase subunit N
MAGPPTGPIALVAVALVLAGLAFNIAAFPYHVYIADVYQGAAAPVAGWLSFVTKAAGFVALAKVLAAIGGPAAVKGVYVTLGWLGEPLWQNALWVLAVATMTVGNVLALWQRSVKRMLAYSSVAHSGYLLVGLLVVPEALRCWPAYLTLFPPQSLADVVVFYLAAYGIANLGAFLVLAVARVDDGHGGTREADSLADLGGLARRNMPLAIAMAIFGFSLMGLPPLVGFMAKVFVFVGAFQSGYVWLVVIAVVNAAVGVAYYLRMIAACWLDNATEGQARDRAGGPAGSLPAAPAGSLPAAPAGSPSEAHAAPRIVVAVLAVLTVLFGLVPSLLYRPMTRYRPASAEPPSQSPGMLFDDRRSATQPDAELKPWPPPDSQEDDAGP